MPAALRWIRTLAIIACCLLAMGAKGSCSGGGGHMAGCHRLAHLWVQAGGASVEPPMLMAAIAKAESGGHAGAVGRDGELGFWQIDPHYWSASADPHENAREAVAVARRQGLRAWTTYRNGAFHGHCGY